MRLGQRSKPAQKENLCNLQNLCSVCRARVNLGMISGGGRGDRDWDFLYLNFKTVMCLSEGIASLCLEE